MDQRLLESLFSDDQGLASLPSYYDELDEESQSLFNLVLEEMEKISPLEADIIELHLKGISQSLLGKIFGFTQPNIHYRLNRATERLKMMVQIEDFDEEELTERLGTVFRNEKDLKVMVYIYLWSSQSKVAKLIGESQGKVRYRFMKGLKVLEEIGELSDIYKSLKLVGENISLLRGAHKTEEMKSMIAKVIL
ncbi:sigma-70 family RNA polymerase sigma factor [bacterium]|nr:sigma-70 family RNA polymerase sigma factor [bacterium]